MPRMGPFRVALTATLFGLLSAGPLSIDLVKAAYSFPHRAADTTPHVADQLPTARSDRLALLIANSSYPDADAVLADVTAGANALAKVLRNRVSSLSLFGTQLAQG